MRSNPVNRRLAGQHGDAMTRHLITVALAAGAAVVAACGGSGPGDDVTRVAPLASADGATSLQQDLVSVVRAVSPSVVQIETPQDLGSGVVFDARGDVVTNAHVVGNARRFVVTLGAGDSHPATAIGRDAANDLAVIRIAGARPRAATFAYSSRVLRGLSRGRADDQTLGPAAPEPVAAGAA
jgi:putative serine protease PepD